MKNLSNEARALLAGRFFMPTASLRFEMCQSVPTKQAEALFSELVDAGLLSRTDNADGSIRYALTDLGVNTDRMPPGQNDDERGEFMNRYGKFKIAEPKPAPKSSAFGLDF